MDQFAGGEMEAPAGDARLLIGEAADVDLDPSLGRVIEGDMLKSVEIEIAVELPVDALEEVKIEGGGHSRPIVVGGLENFRVFLQVDADQHLASGAEHAGIVGQERYCGIG